MHSSLSTSSESIRVVNDFASSQAEMSSPCGRKKLEISPPCEETGAAPRARPRGGLILIRRSDGLNLNPPLGRPFTRDLLADYNSALAFSFRRTCVCVGQGHTHVAGGDGSNGCNLARRQVTGGRILQAQPRHIYDRLVTFGGSSSRAVRAYYRPRPGILYECLVTFEGPSSRAFHAYYRPSPGISRAI